MQNSIEQLYQEMMEAIKAKSCQPNKTDLVESCFWIANNYWNSLKKNIDTASFIQLSQEIDFFKNQKPKFTSQIQFYTILTEVLLFIPDETDLKLEFWKYEHGRFQNFCERNKAFIDYLVKGREEYDSTYFVQVGPDWIPYQQPAFYDADKNFMSSPDHLVRGYLAHQMYHQYVTQKLNELKTIES